MNSPALAHRRSDPLFAILIAGAFLIALGHLLYWLIPAPAPADIDLIAKGLLARRRLIIPEPQEKGAYIGLLLALVPVLLVAFHVVRKRKWSAGAAAGRIASVLAIAVFCALLVGDTFWWRFVSPKLLSRWPWYLACAFAVLSYATAGRPSAKAISDLSLVAIAVAAGTVLSFCWRVFDIHTIANSGVYYDHYDAAISSLVKIAKGETCLVEVVPQYGCYGELMAPLVRSIGLSTLSITLVFGALQAATFLLLAVASHQLIKEPAVLATVTLLFIPVTNRMWHGLNEPFIQGLPIRMLFPVLSLLAARSWIKRPSASKALALGGFSVIAMVWNLDTGAVVSIALAGLVLFSGCTDPNWHPRQLAGRMSVVSAYFFGIALSICVAVLVLRLKAGTWPDLADYAVFQRMFFVSGAFMLPMSAFPSLWTAFAGAAVIAMGLVTARSGQGPRDERLELIGFLAILSLGLLSYYVGRSHWHTLALVSWPFLLLAFSLIDRAWHRLLKTTSWTRIGGRLALAAGLAWSIIVVAEEIPIIADVTAKNWGRYQHTVPSEDVDAEIAYLRTVVPPDSKVAVLAWNQGTIFAETDLRSAVTGRSLAETLRRADADFQIAQILGPGVDHLILGTNLSFDYFDRDARNHWIWRRMRDIRQKYALVGWSPNGTLAHLIRRDLQGERRDLFDDGPSSLDIRAIKNPQTGVLVGPYGRPVGRELWFALQSDFRVDLRFTTAAGQAPYATLLSTYRGGDKGFSLEMDGSSLDAVLGIGTADGFKPITRFRIEPDVAHDLALSLEGRRLRLVMDGVVRYDAAPEHYVNSSFPVTLGGLFVPVRDMRWDVSEVHFELGRRIACGGLSRHTGSLRMKFADGPVGGTTDFAKMINSCPPWLGP